MASSEKVDEYIFEIERMFRMVRESKECTAQWAGMKISRGANRMGCKSASQDGQT